jgi:hypothetical protein
MQRADSGKSRGSSLVEFALVAFQLSLIVFASLDFSRMVLVYTDLANAARVGARYAITHGSKRTGSGADGPSGPGDNPAQVVSVVKDYARSGLLDPNKLSVSVKYTNSLNDPGNPVVVSVSYTYDPFFTLLPLRVPLGSTTKGIITF